MSGIPSNSPAPATGAKPRLRSDLRIRHSLDGRQDLFVLEDVVAGKCYEVGAREAACLLACNGMRNLEEVAAVQKTVNSQRPPLNPEAIHRLVLWATSKQLFEDHSEQAVGRQKHHHATQQRARWLRWTNPISFTVALGSPERLFQRIAPSLQWMFDLRLVPVAFLLSVYAVYCLYEHADRFSNQIVSIWADQQWLPLLIVWILFKFFHELAHGIVGHRYGARVRDCGLFFILFLPLAFVDVSGADRLSSRWQRIHIAAAGMYFELFCAAIATIVWAGTTDVTLACWMHAIVVSAGVNTILFNANPLMRFDGYYILADLIGIPNLAPRGKTWLMTTCKRVCLGMSSPPLDMPWYKRTFVAIYGVLAFAWRILIQITLTIGAAALFHGLGIFIAVLATLHFLMEPIRNTIAFFQTQRPWTQWRWQNITVSLAGFATFAWLITAMLTEPVSMSAPGVVRYPEERLIRAGGDGFLTKIAVKHGETVVAGQLLARLENLSLEMQSEGLRLQIEQAHQHASIARQNADWTEYENQLHLAKSLQSQLVEREAELAGLELRSPCAGTVVHPELDELVGQYYKKGTVVLTIDDGCKEVAISISQDDLASLPAADKTEVHIIFPALARTSGNLLRVNPTASEMVPAPALARSHGGPLLVQSRSTDSRVPTRFAQHRQVRPEVTSELQLLSPRVTGVVELRPQIARELRVGQTGVVFFPAQKQSLASYLVQATRRWIYGHLRQSQQLQ